MNLTEQQLKILKEADPPFRRDHGKLVRITAGAGTGKTTTLLQLAARYARNGQTSITYLTFNKAAAKDGKRRLEKVVPGLEARTMHSCAMSLLAKHRREAYDETQVEENLITDEKLKEKIAELARGEIQDFLKHAFATIERENAKEEASAKETKKIKSLKEQATKQVIFFIFKTLCQFCRKDVSLEFLKDSKPSKYEAYKRNYYPAQKYHNFGKGEKAGFDKSYYEGRLGFYADTAAKLWDQLKNVRSFDLEMKRAQLLGLPVEGSVILADECQDLDACQIHFLTQQIRHGKDIFFVGDAAQTIYSFRGAKAENLLNMKGIDYQLTESFRFGTNIARMANLILFAKERSPQTTSKEGKKTWRPYRLIGSGRKDGYVTSEPLSNLEAPFTLIAFANATLMVEALKILGMPVCANSREDHGNTVANDLYMTQQVHLPLQIPKFHINGKGQNSGLRRWKKIVEEVRALYRLFQTREKGDAIELPKSAFPEFHGEKVTWSAFMQKVEDQELSKYASTLQVLTLFQNRTLEAIQLFETQVMEKPYTAEEADVILSTCHAAKGMEWDRVQLCSDFVKFDKVWSYAGPNPNTRQSIKRKRGLDHFQQQRTRFWQFKLQSWGDDVNVLYVACTRAKLLLSIPEELQELLRNCDRIHDYVARSRASSFFGQPQETQLDTTLEGADHQNAPFLDEDLIEPLRAEMMMKTGQSLLEQLVRQQEQSAVVTPENSQETVVSDSNLLDNSVKRALFKDDSG